ncbi:hypothetical protein [Ideonella sp.]|uniref:hypothetical protein n=1 Tax=Ideonella sp. TaxID=1929293 RepID=UPI002E33A19A|nr:hypothetical protein [Ideonella sp.]
MFVSQVAQSAWHAWMLCRLLMADLRAARQAPGTASAKAPVDAAVLAAGDSFDVAEHQ